MQDTKDFEKFHSANKINTCFLQTMGSFALLLVSLKSPQQPSVQRSCFAIFRPTDVIEFREIFVSIN